MTQADYPDLGTWILRFEDGMKLGDGMNCIDVERWSIRRERHGRWALKGNVEGSPLGPNLLVGLTTGLTHACTTRGWCKLVRWKNHTLFPHDAGYVFNELRFLREVYRRVLTEDD